MPIYEYRCQECETKFEALRSMKDADAKIECKKCTSKNTVRVPSACFSRTAGSTRQTGSTGCAGCSGGSCGSCGH